MNNFRNCVDFSFIPEKFYIGEPKPVTIGISYSLENFINKKALNSKGIILENTKEKNQKIVTAIHSKLLTSKPDISNNEFSSFFFTKSKLNNKIDLLFIFHFKGSFVNMSRESWEYYNTHHFYFCCKNKFQLNSFVENFETLNQKCLFPSSFVFMKCSPSVVVLSCEDDKNIFQKIKKVEKLGGVGSFETPGLKKGILFHRRYYIIRKLGSVVLKRYTFLEKNSVFWSKKCVFYNNVKPFY